MPPALQAGGMRLTETRRLSCWKLYVARSVKKRPAAPPYSNAVSYG